MFTNLESLFYMRLHHALVVLLFGLTMGVPVPILKGSFLRIEILKNVNSELRTTFLGDGVVKPFTGTAPYGTVEGIDGELIPFNPIDACEEAKPSMYISMSKKGKPEFKHNGFLNETVVLVKAGGSCSIEQKILNIQKVPNVVGVLVYLADDRDSLDSVNTRLQDSAVNIPGFLISNSLGQDLLSKIEKYWTPGPDTDFDLPKPSEKGVIPKSQMQEMKRASTHEPWIRATLYYVNDRAQIKSVLLMILMIVSIFLLAAFLGSLLMHFQMWRQQRRESRQRQLPNTDEIPHLPPIDAAFISNLRQVDFMTEKDATICDEKGKAPIEAEMPIINWSNKSCPICLEEFSPGERVVELPCGHHYHSPCITPWLMNRSPCCPLCKIDTRVGPANALLIQMGKPPVLPKPQFPNFFKYYTTNCWQMLNCRTSE